MVVYHDDIKNYYVPYILLCFARDTIKFITESYQIGTRTDTYTVLYTNTFLFC